MKRYRDAATVKKEIDSYEKHFTGAPLLVGVDQNSDYVALMGLLKVDYEKQIIVVSDTCHTEFPPDPTFQITEVSKAAKTKPVVWVGAAQAIMLYGQKEAEKFFINLLGNSFGGPVTVICPFCCNLLEAIGRKYFKLSLSIIILNNDQRDIPSINISNNEYTYLGETHVKGIAGLLRTMEEGDFESSFNVVTTCDIKYLSGSVYPVSEGLSSYKMLCKIEPGIAARTEEGNGTKKQWDLLAKEVQGCGSFAALCNKKLCDTKRLSYDFGEFLASTDEDRFLCFIALKTFYGNGADYLGYCLKKSLSADKFEPTLYEAILDVNPDDKKFNSWIRQRRQMLQTMDDNASLMKTFCEKATIKGEKILWYLSDETEEERAALIHALCCYSYTTDVFEKILPVVSVQLSQYLQQFIFDSFNTRVMESDAYVRDLLTRYFQRYKLQKLTNHIEPDFVDFVQEEAKKRSFTKLQARSAIVKKVNKKDAQPYFFDALGAEFLSFIKAKATEYGMQFECYVGHCNLPSITCKNKEFYNAFPEGSILKEEGLDEIKHHGTKYDFQFTKEPLHIFDELNVLDRDLRKMGSALASGQYSKIIILSDHGASRLAVTYCSENKKLELSEPGKHSGRCCPSDTDPGIPFVTYEDGFAVLANYERFKGSRKADVEAHGGATLEETVVPVIVLTLMPKEQQLFFTESVVTCSPKDGSSIRLFANPPLKKPRMMINETSYDGYFDGDQHNIVFKMPDIRRKGHHEATIYDAGKFVATLAFETKRQTGSNQLI